MDFIVNDSEQKRGVDFISVFIMVNSCYSTANGNTKKNGQNFNRNTPVVLVSTKCRLQTADCRLGTKMQSAVCSLHNVPGLHFVPGFHFVPGLHFVLSLQSAVFILYWPLVICALHTVFSEWEILLLFLHFKWSF